VTAVETRPASPSYEGTPDFGEVKRLAAQGWRLFSSTPIGGNIWYVLQWSAPDTAELDKARAHITRLSDELAALRRALAAEARTDGQAWDDLTEERDRLQQALADEEGRSADLRDLADRLAEQIQRVRNLPARNSDGRVRDYLPRASVLAALDGGVS
jgi:hypothetical protein